MRVHRPTAFGAMALFAAWWPVAALPGAGTPLVGPAATETATVAPIGATNTSPSPDPAPSRAGASSRPASTPAPTPIVMGPG